MRVCSAAAAECRWCPVLLTALVLSTDGAVGAAVLHAPALHWLSLPLRISGIRDAVEAEYRWRRWC